MKISAPTATTCTAQKHSPFNLLAARATKPVRIPPPIISTRPALRGDKAYLRALRAAEMALWDANLKFPASVALLCVAIAMIVN